MLTPALILCLLAPAASTDFVGPPEASPIDVLAQAPAPFTNPDRPGRVEHFILVWRGSVVGVSRLRETHGSHGPLFERETYWFEDTELRVLEVEEPLRPGPVLVWREMRPGGGRTLVLERRAAGVTALTDWCGSTAPGRRLFVAPTTTPLERLSRARRRPGPARGPEPLAFQPLAGGSESLERRATGLLGYGPRWSVWRRSDGSEAERALFLGPVLVARRAARSGPWSLAVAPARYEELLVEYENRSDSSSDGPVTNLVTEGPRSVR